MPLLYCYYNNKLIWKYSYEEEVKNGIIISMITINENYSFKFKNKIINKDNYLNIINVNMKLTLPTKFTIEENYGWWIKNNFNDPNTLYNLINFKNKEFIEGFIMGANYLNKDFRDLIFNCPFDKDGYIYIEEYFIINRSIKNIKTYVIPYYGDQIYEMDKFDYE